MNDDHVLTVIRDHLAEAQSSLGEMPTGAPATEIFAQVRKRRHRRAIAALTAACVSIGLALALVLPSGTQSRPVHVHVAAWSVDTNSNGTVTVTVRQLTHAAQLQHALAEAGVPAIVTFRKECLNNRNQNAFQKAGVVFKVSVHPPGEIITPSQIPPGDKLLFSIIPVTVRSSSGAVTHGRGFGWGLVKAGQPLHCTQVKIAEVYPRSGTR